MAGTKIKDEFRELISPFLKSKMIKAERELGKDSSDYIALEKQYIINNSEKNIEANLEKPRHYQSGVNGYYDNKPLVGLERLYKKTILIEPTTVCAAHCRWCVRGQYPVQTMSKDNIVNATKYIGSDERANELDEVLITGGDPLMSILFGIYTKRNSEKCKKHKNYQNQVEYLFMIQKEINDKMLEVFTKFKKFRFELGTHVNHPVEFWPESVESIKRLQSVGFKIYNQNPLLKGVNDDFKTLAELYTLLRDNDIENHYLFHAVPLRGMSHHRTSVDKGLELITALSSSGEFSGRTKPKYCILSDIGKIVLYQDTIIKRDEKTNSILLKSGFNIEDRLKWNPSWKSQTLLKLIKMVL